MELVVNKHGVISDEGYIPEEYYKSMEDEAITLISLSIVRELFENGLLKKEEYEYIHKKYIPCT